MHFADTQLPDQPIFTDAFKAGWARYVLRFAGDTATAMTQYLRGPVAMARLIVEHGGESRETAAAACLAGPAAFSMTPSDTLHPRLAAFCNEICAFGAGDADELYRTIPAMSGDARMFFQVSAILLLEQAANGQDSAAEREHVYTEALKLYTAARGTVDAYRLDTRFEIAAMKATMALDNQPYLWSVRKPEPVVAAV